MFSWSGIGFIVSAVGKPVRLHPETELCSNFEEAKVFVETDMLKILPKSYRFRSTMGIDAEVEFLYPWLPASVLFAQNGIIWTRFVPSKEELSK